MQTEFGKGLDWPLSYDDLWPFYDEIQEEIGLSGTWEPKGGDRRVIRIQCRRSKYLRKES